MLDGVSKIAANCDKGRVYIGGGVGGPSWAPFRHPRIPGWADLTRISHLRNASGRSTRTDLGGGVVLTTSWASCPSCPSCPQTTIAPDYKGVGGRGGSFHITFVATNTTLTLTSTTATTTTTTSLLLRK